MNQPLSKLSALTVDVFVPPPHQQRAQQKQQQADAHAAHDQAREVLLLCQRHLAQMPDGVRLPPLAKVNEVNDENVNTGLHFFHRRPHFVHTRTSLLDIATK